MGAQSSQVRLADRSRFRQTSVVMHKPLAPPSVPKLSINIDVDDLEKGVVFYSGAFGLTPRRRFGGSAVELAGAEAPVYLLHKPRSTPPFPDAQTHRDYGRHWTPVHIDFNVENMEYALDRALAAGARAESQIESFGWGRVVLMSDPFGNGFCLIELDAHAAQAMATPYVPQGG
jgi:predicted enzyme related to lactoylglutathione lyase